MIFSINDNWSQYTQGHKETQNPQLILNKKADVLVKHRLFFDEFYAIMPWQESLLVVQPSGSRTAQLYRFSLSHLESEGT